jgi:PAS domain S-box-containing protein
MTNQPSKPATANILIVDDHLQTLRLLSTTLMKQGYQVKCVSNGEMALSTVQLSPPDLVLLDIMMPDMDGYQVCQQLKSHPQTCEIPIIFISALHESIDKVQAFSLGAIDYITKPFDLEEVLLRIHHHLHLQFLQKRLTEKNQQLQQEIQARQEAEEKFSKAFWASPDAISLMTLAEQRYLDVNDSFCRLLGYPRSQIIGKTAQELQLFFNSESASCYQELLQSHQTIQNLEVELQTNVGNIKTVLLSAELIEINQQTCVLTVSKDITERKQAENDLLERESQYRNLVETSQDMIWSVDLEGRFTFVNGAVKQMYGYQPEEMIGRPFSEFVAPAQISKDLQVFQKILAGTPIFQYETLHLTKDGKPLNLLFNAIAMRDHQGHVIGSTGTASDISDRKQVEDELRLLLAVTQAISRAQDLDTVLSVILNLICTTINWDFGEAWIPAQDGSALTCSPAWYCSDPELVSFRQVSEPLTFEAGRGLPGRIWVSQQPEWIEDVSCCETSIFYRMPSASQVELKACFGVPILANQNVLAILIFFKRTAESQDSRLLDLINAVATQLGGLVERKTSEIALRQSEERLQLALAANRDGLFDIHFQTNDYYYSPQWRTLMGYPQDTPGPDFRQLLALIHPDDIELVRLSLEEVFTGKLQIWQSEFRVLQAHREVWSQSLGIASWILARGQVFRNQAGELVRMSGTFSDISDRKHAEIALWQQLKREWLVGAMLERIRSSLNLDEVLTMAVREVREFLNCDRTLIFRFNSDWSGVVAVESVTEGVQSILGSEISDPCFGNFYANLYEQGRIRAIDDVDRAELNPCHLNLLHSFGVKANLIVPVMHSDSQPYLHHTHRLWGLLIAQHCSSPRPWHASEVESLRQLSVQLAIAIQQCTLFEQAQVEITERKLAETKLRESEQRFRDVSEALGEYLWEMDAEAHYTFVTDRVKSVKGYTPQQLIGRTPLAFMPDEDIEIVHQALQQAAQTETPFKIEHRHLKPSGEVVWEEISGIVLLDAQGRRTGFRGAGLEITERKRFQETLQQAKEMADAANRAKSEFLANMSHELRTPLNAILGFAQMMARDPTLNLQQQEHLKIINRSGEHLLILINDILEMSKIEAGRASFHENQFDLRYLLNNLTEMLSLKAQKKGLEFRIDSAVNLPQFVQTDESKLRQVLINLLGNAIKFTQAGSVILRVLKSHETPTQVEPAPRTKLIFEVEDTGPGIALEEMKQLFQVFAQTETGRNSHQGTGLGLAISQKFVQLMGGNLSVQSTLGIGSRFTFDIEVTAIQSEQVQPIKPAQQVLKIVPPHAEYRILVVEDVKVNRLLIVKLLSCVGFVVREATNGKEGIEVWKSWNPHLIFMDMQMPVMDGYEATRWIKDQPHGHQTPIIALTTSAFEEQLHRVLLAGCDDFIYKPFRENDIFEKISEYLGVQYVYEASPQASTSSPIQLPVPSHTLDIESLKNMPVEWIDHLHQAAVEADAELILNLAQQIPASSITLAQALTDLVNRFQFEKITDLTEQILQ